MDVARRMEQLLQDEHAKLRALLPEVTDAVTKLARPGERSPHKLRPSQGTVGDPRMLQEAWKLFSSQLAPHLDRERDVVFPLLRDLATEAKSRRRMELPMWMDRMEEDHAQLRRLALLVKSEVSTLEVPAVKRSVLVVLELFENHTRAEELELYPAIEGTPAPKGRTSDDMLRSLRRVKRKETEDDEPEGLLDRLRNLFRRD